MDIEIVFSLHALQKFDILRRHGIEVSQARVSEIVISPEQTDHDSLGNPIAQGRLDDTHVLRVVYRIQENKRIVITFYPGRRERYEN
jgi:hypothetical protein